MKLAALLLLPILLLSCNGNDTSEANSLDGVWESVGYGRLVKIVDGQYVMAEVTKISCIPILDGDISDFGEALYVKNDTLTLEDGINYYYFTRVEDAPAICKKDSPERTEAEQKANDPEYNFEVLWHTFDEHYAYFELRKIDWDSMYAHYRPKVNENTTPVELFGIMDEMLNAFNDGHIGLDVPDEIYEQAAANSEEEEEASQDPPVKRLRKYLVAKAVAEKYIPKGTAIKNNNLRWGILDGNVGYVQLNQMMGLADYGVSDTLSYRDYWMAYFEKGEESLDSTSDELEGFNDSLDQLMAGLDETDALIIDVRFNGGGKDEVGMEFLARVNGEEKVTFTKKGRMGDGYTPTIKVVQPAVENPYEKPVFLLISTESASATEIMTLSSLSLENITRIGSRTEGVFSDILDRVLPNEWTFGLSSEVYETLDGKNYEGPGIPPDIELGYPRDTQLFLKEVMQSLEDGDDAAIEKALELIKE